MRYRGAEGRCHKIASRLNVDAVVEGRWSGRRQGADRGAADPRATDQHLWAESYERDFKDVLSLQSEIAQRIADEVRVTVTPQERETLKRARQVNSEAHEHYLMGRYHWNKRSEQSVKKAVTHFQQAIDPRPYLRAGLCRSGGLLQHTRLLQFALSLETRIRREERPRRRRCSSMDAGRTARDFGCGEARLRMGLGRCRGGLSTSDYKESELCRSLSLAQHALEPAGTTPCRRTSGEEKSARDGSAVGRHHSRPCANVLFPSRVRSRNRTVSRGAGAGSKLPASRTYGWRRHSNKKASSTRRSPNCK